MNTKDQNITIEGVEAALRRLVDTPPTRQWKNPYEPAWYEWDLGARNQGPRLAIRLLVPCISILDNEGSTVPDILVTAAKAIATTPFRVIVVRAPGTKHEKALKQLFRVNRSGVWEKRICDRVVQAWKLLRAAPSCPACRAATYPNQIVASKKWFWSCCKWPGCRGSKRTEKIDGKYPTKIEQMAAL